MSNPYATSLLVEQRLTELRHEADQERLARLVRRDIPRRRRWWERLMLFSRASSSVPSHGQRSWQPRPADVEQPRTHVTASPRGGASRPAATIATGDSPC